MCIYICCINVICIDVICIYIYVLCIYIYRLYVTCIYMYICLFIWYLFAHVSLSLSLTNVQTSFLACHHPDSQELFWYHMSVLFWRFPDLVCHRAAGSGTSWYVWLQTFLCRRGRKLVTWRDGSHPNILPINPEGQEAESPLGSLPWCQHPLATSTVWGGIVTDSLDDDLSPWALLHPRNKPCALPSPRWWAFEGGVWWFAALGGCRVGPGPVGAFRSEAMVAAGSRNRMKAMDYADWKHWKPTICPPFWHFGSKQLETRSYGFWIHRFHRCFKYRLPCRGLEDSQNSFGQRHHSSSGSYWEPLPCAAKATESSHGYGQHMAVTCLESKINSREWFRASSDLTIWLESWVCLGIDEWRTLTTLWSPSPRRLKHVQQKNVKQVQSITKVCRNPGSAVARCRWKICKDKLISTVASTWWPQIANWNDWKKKVRRSTQIVPKDSWVSHSVDHGGHNVLQAMTRYLDAIGGWAGQRCDGDPFRSFYAFSIRMLGSLCCNPSYPHPGTPRNRDGRRRPALWIPGPGWFRQSKHCGAPWWMMLGLCITGESTNQVVGCWWVDLDSV